MQQELIKMFVTNRVSLFLLQGTKENGLCTCGSEFCNSIGKHPYMKRSWKTIDNRDESSIAFLFKTMEKKGLNLAAKTGLQNEEGKYLVVVDIDTEDSELIPVLKKHETFSYRTGGGGYHFWFWSKENVKNSVSLLANKVDIRGDGGYVVVPPSVHKSGKKYELISKSLVIKDLPEEIAVALAEAKNALKKRVKKVDSSIALPSEKADLNNPLVGIWSRKTVTEIRESIANGEQVPNGVRNNCLHRLLSSDRAKGISSAEDLTQNAIKYTESFHGEIHMVEIERTVKSVLKYPVYNNQCENVHKNYVAWVTEKYSKTNGEELLEKLEAIDAKFFQILKESNDLMVATNQEIPGVSLDSILEVRKSFYRKHGLNRFSNYRPSLFAKKLKEIGFLRKRTKKFNLWVLSLDALERLCYGRPTDAEVAKAFGTNIETDRTEEERLEMSNANNTANAAPAQAAAARAGNGLKEIASKKIKIKVKRHPLQWKYEDSIHTEYTRDQMNVFTTLTEEELATYLNQDELLAEDSVNSFMDEVQDGDVIGVGYKMYKIISRNEDGYDCTRPLARDEATTLTRKEIDTAIAMDRVDILYRSDKPYGQPEYVEETVRIFSRNTDDSSNEEQSPTDSAAIASGNTEENGQ